jgi:ribosomal protein S6--L-glutamate ligase
MILSYHPCFVADKNLLCAGRKPNTDDLNAIRSASAVVLPQGCRKSLYEMAQMNCQHVFPNYDARFRFEGKTGQIRLFRRTGMVHPKTEIYHDIGAYNGQYDDRYLEPDIGFPLVFKLNWGGEGKHVYLIKSSSELLNVLQMATTFERSGQSGFIIQEYVQSENRSLRVVVIGQTYISYWRIQKNRKEFCSSLAKGAVIDKYADSELKEIAVQSVKGFCRLTGINLAGFDMLFSSDAKENSPLFLEINYFFGRRGLGGSERFYALLETEIKKWIDSLGLPVGR